ncbi:hypothetical protein ACO0QE_004459 [Hanseniaspora vineae]
MASEQIIQQLIQAIDLANNPASQAELNAQALQFLNDTKTATNAPEIFIELIKFASSSSQSSQLPSSSSSSSTLVSATPANPNNNIYKFVGFQALAELIPNANINQLQLIKSYVIEYASAALAQASTSNNNINNITTSDPEYVRNKVCEIFSILFYFMYGQCNNNLWNTFFQDLMAILKLEPIITCPSSIINDQVCQLGLDYFLRITLQINTEIADQTFVVNKQVQQKNNSLKDFMRMNDITNLTTVWLNVLINLSSVETVINLALTNVGSFVSWIDINLIVQPQFISSIFKFLDTNTVACCTCLSEIIAKKMKPADKLQLLQLLNLTDKITQLFNTQDLEIIENLAKLVNAIGIEYTIICENASASESSNNTKNGNKNLNNATNGNIDPNNSEYVQMADTNIVQNVCPLILQFLSNEDFFEVNLQVLPFISSYLSFLKKNFALGGKPGSAVNLQSRKLTIDQAHLTFCKNLLIVVHNKSLINDNFDIDSIEEINEFDENFRSKIKNFQDSVAVINPDLYLNHMVEIVSQNGMLFNTDNTGIERWRIEELFIYQLHNFAESIRNNLFGIQKNVVIESKPFLLMCEFMKNKFLKKESILQYVANPWIQISYFELIVRHHNFLLVDQAASQENILYVLNIFASEFGMFSSMEKVRFRCWFLFSRFIKLVKPSLDFSTLVSFFTKISPLLIINVPPTQQAAENALVNEISNQDTTFENQLYLFEGAGILVSSSKSLDFSILDGVLNPLFRSLEVCIGAPVKTCSTVLEIHHIMMAIGTLARGIHSGLVPENLLSNQTTNEKLLGNQSLIEVFSNIAEVVLVTFQYFHSFELVRDATRFVFARLISILNTNIISFINRLLATFYETEMKVVEMNDFLGFVGQIVHTFQNNEDCYQLLNNMITPLVKKVFKLIEDTKLETSSSSTTAAVTSASPSPEPAGVSGNTTVVVNANGVKDKNVVVTDAYREIVEIKRGLYNFMQSLITNHVTSLLLTESNKNTLSIVLNDLLAYTPQDLKETSVMKIKLNVLINLVRFLGTGSCVDPDDAHSNDLIKLEGLNEFFIAKTVPLVFEIPFNPEYAFNIKDGSYRIVASDLSRLLKVCYLSNSQSGGSPNPLLTYMNDYYFPQIQFPPSFTMEFIQALEQLNEKKFDQYYVGFINKIKSE